MTAPLDLDAIQARLDAATPGTWWNGRFEIYAGEPGNLSLSTWIGETCDVELEDSGEANAAAIAATHNALPALLARVRQLEAELAKYVGHEPTVAEEMAELRRGYFAAHEVCDAAVLQIVRSETQRPVPEWVAAVRAALDGEPAA